MGRKLPVTSKLGSGPSNDNNLRYSKRESKLICIVCVTHYPFTRKSTTLNGLRQTCATPVRLNPQTPANAEFKKLLIPKSPNRQEENQALLFFAVVLLAVDLSVEGLFATVALDDLETRPDFVLLMTAGSRRAAEAANFSLAFVTLGKVFALEVLDLGLVSTLRAVTFLVATAFFVTGFFSMTLFSATLIAGFAKDFVSFLANFVPPEAPFG